MNGHQIDIYYMEIWNIGTFHVPKLQNGHIEFLYLCVLCKTTMHGQSLPIHVENGHACVIKHQKMIQCNCPLFDECKVLAIDCMMVGVTMQGLDGHVTSHAWKQQVMTSHAQTSLLYNLEF